MFLSALKKALKKSGFAWRIFWMWQRFKLKRRTAQVFRYDKRMFLKHAGCFAPSKGNDLAYCYHKIEKGLAFPHCRPGFGKQVVYELISAIRGYVTSDNDPGSFECRHALNALAAYKKRHEEMGVPLDSPLREELESLLCLYPATSSKASIQMKDEELFQHRNADFAAFSASRHSIREFAGKAPEQNILAAISLAANAPSACNRQPWRVHYYKDPGQIKSLLHYQNGNRGFGHLSEQLLIITADMSCILWPEERRDLHINAGLFIMNLSYSLHYYGIAHCLLNASFPVSDEPLLQNMGNIPRNEEILLMIICGKAPQTVHVTASPRKEASDFLTIHSKR